MKTINEIWHPKFNHPSCIYPYKDKDGNILFYTCRFEIEGGKVVLPYRFSVKTKKWEFKAPDAPRPLYNLSDLCAKPDAKILIVEGEKTANAAREILPDYCVLTFMGGCQSIGNADWTVLEGKDVVLFPDNDEQGVLAFTQKLPSLIYKLVKSLHIVSLPELLPEKWDLADAIPKGFDIKSALDCAKPIEINADLPNGFEINENMLMWRNPAKDDEIIWITKPIIEVKAETRTIQSDNWGLLVSFYDSDGNIKEVSIPIENLKSDCADIRGILMNEGLKINTADNKGKNKFSEFLLKSEPYQKVYCADRIGWHEKSFIFPDICYGNKKLYLQAIGNHHSHIQLKGSLDDWQNEIGLYLDGNSRLIFAVSSAFAAITLYPMEEESGGFHFTGSSSIGKSTVLAVAGSIIGGGGIRGYMQQWRATSNGLETIAMSHCDILLCLDEIGQVDGRDVGNIAYMLANGSGKIRATKNGGNQKTKEWRTLFLSSGEVSLSDKIAENGKKIHAGQENRFVDIPADTNSGMGVFEELHGFKKPALMAKHFKDKSNEFYGAPIRAFLEKFLENNFDQYIPFLCEQRDRFIKECTPQNSEGQIGRIIRRFALVAAAGELAIKLQILPLFEGDSFRAAKQCLNSHIINRGHLGSSEIENGIMSIKRFIEQNANINMVSLDKNKNFAGDHTDKAKRLGFKVERKDGLYDYMFLPTSFKESVCSGYNHISIAKELQKRGLIVPSNDGKPYRNERLPEIGSKKVYYIKAEILDYEPVLNMK